MIRLFRATDFRCLNSVELEFDPVFNLIHGANASGKTSLLEALAYLGRGKSFRGATAQALVRHGQADFVLYGETEVSGRRHRLGVRNGRSGFEARVDGQSDIGAAGLAESLPLLVIDPEVHNLVAGGPEQRRRYLDWIAFHVEHEHLDAWRRFRRVLKQRNAALRAGQGAAVIRSWDSEFLVQSRALDASRRRALATAGGALAGQGEALLGATLGFDYQQGWSRDRELGDVLAEGLERDRHLGATQHGPHRADLKISYDERVARKLVSRGQQKLLAATMVLAAADAAQAALGRPPLLLLDDPAAELDRPALIRLMAAVTRLGCQVVATSLDPGALEVPPGSAMFHVEQGSVGPDPGR